MTTVDPRYKNAYIYNIVNTASNDPHDIYVGSSINASRVRFAGHKADWKAQRDGKKNHGMVLYDKFTEFNIENFKIVVYEHYPCNNKEELVKREEEVRLLLQPNYNVKRAFVDEETKKMEQRASASAWNKAHPEQFKQNNAKWSKAHPENSKKWYHANKEKIKEEGRYWCEACDCAFASSSSLKNHLQSTKHKLEYAEYVYDCELDRLSYIFDDEHP